MHKLPLPFSLVFLLSTCALHTMDQSDLAKKASGLNVKENNLQANVTARLERLEAENIAIKKTVRGCVFELHTVKK